MVTKFTKIFLGVLALLIVLVTLQPVSVFAFGVGGCAEVYGSNGAGGLRVRSGPGLNYGQVGTIYDGTVVKITEGPRSNNGYTWWKHDRGGWSAGSYLRDKSCGSNPTPPPPSKPGELRVVESLTLSNTNPRVGESITARFKVRNVGGQALVLRELSAGARRGSDWNGVEVDFPKVSNITLSPNQEYTYQQSRSFSIAGGHFAEPVVNINGWGGIGGANRVSFNVQNNVSDISCAVGQFKAEYFNNRSLSGAPAYRACESPHFDRDWGGGGPGNGVGNDNFSIRWTGTFAFDAARYRFTAGGDDGFVMKLDGANILSEWSDHGFYERATERDVSAGNHTVVVEYYENGGGARAKARWDKTTVNQAVYNSAFLTDAQLEDYNSLNAEQIRYVLNRYGSYFRQTIPDADGVNFDPPTVIAQAAQTYRINPKVLLVTLEKEHNGVTRTTRPSDAQMRFLMGCVASNTARQQLMCAAERLRAYHNQLNSNGVTVSGWRVGTAKNSQDGVSVTPATKAVAGQFTYTPYAGVQWGGNQSSVGGVYLFYNAWNRLDMSAPPIAQNTCPTITDWKGEYFSNRNLSGNPVMCRNDGAINFDWGGGSPGGNVPSDNFSVRWTRNANFENARYKFTVAADDGIRLWVNNALVIDQWKDQGTTTYTWEGNLPGGSLPLKVEYYENGGGAVARVAWEKIGTQPPPPPSGSAIQYRNDNGTHIARINLRDSNVRFHVAIANNDTGGRESVQSMASKHSAKLAINGDYFDTGRDQNNYWSFPWPQGMTWIDGADRTYRCADHPTNCSYWRADWWRSSLAIGRDNRADIGRAEQRRDSPNKYNVISGGPHFIKNGQYTWSVQPRGSDCTINDEPFPSANCPYYTDTRMNWTAVGLTQDGNTMVIIVGGNMLPGDMNVRMKAEGAYNALKLDGGGSSAFYYAGTMRYGGGRDVANALLVFAP